MAIALPASVMCFSAAAMIAALAWGEPLTLAVLNGIFNVVSVTLTTYVIQIIPRLDKEVYRGGE